MWTFIADRVPGVLPRLVALNQVYLEEGLCILG